MPTPKIARRIVRKPPGSALEVRHSTVHGQGAFAARNLRRGARIGHYAGQRLSADEVAAMDWDAALTYVFGLSDGSVIDGSDGGNATRHINHSCEPNCVAWEIEGDDGHLRVEIEALRSIVAGSELLLDYRLQIDEGRPEDYPCRCGAAACRGSLIAAAPETEA